MSETTSPAARTTTSREFFESKYQESADPWSFASSEYELARYEAAVRALGNRRYRHAFEPACSVGVLTAKLAAICDQVEAIDISPTAAAVARKRCAELANVTIRCASLSDGIPAEFDLLMFSEIGYYFTRDELRGVLGRCVERLAMGGTLLGVHWLGSSADHLLSGDEVHETIATIPGLALELSERYNAFRLERWRKIEGPR